MTDEDARRIARALVDEFLSRLGPPPVPPEVQRTAPAKRRAVPPPPKSVDEVTRERARRVIRSRGLVGSPR